MLMANSNALASLNADSWESGLSLFIRSIISQLSWQDDELCSLTLCKYHFIYNHVTHLSAKIHTVLTVSYLIK